jgi:hypothetical protein
MTVHKKLNQVRVALLGTAMTKSGLNKFANYRYFELNDFMPVVQKMFDDYGLCGIVSYGPTLATLTITDIDDMTHVEVTSPMSTAALKGCHEVQNLGAVLSYIRRYLWVTALEIVEHDALDAMASNPSEEEPAFLTDEQIEYFGNWAKEKGVDRAKLYPFLTEKAGFLVTKIADCPASLYPVIQAYLSAYSKENTQ